MHGLATVRSLNQRKRQVARQRKRDRQPAEITVGALSERRHRLTLPFDIASDLRCDRLMAWSGVAVVQAIGNGVARITGVSLDKFAVGTVGLSGGPGNISLPANFATLPPLGLTLVDVVDCSWHELAAGDVASSIVIAKVASPFLITFTNALKQATPPLELYIFHRWRMSGWVSG